MEILWSCDAHVISNAHDAARAFAHEHWAQQRKIRAWNPAESTFRVVLGTRTYQVTYDAGERFSRIPTWQVFVKAE